MSCEYCKRDFGHDKRCPNYIPKKCKHYCSICGDGIYNGEEYLYNNGEYIHWECRGTDRELVKWFGCEIGIMEENNE